MCVIAANPAAEIPLTDLCAEFRHASRNMEVQRSNVARLVAVRGMSARPASILGVRKVHTASTAGARGIQSPRIRLRTNQTNLSNRASSSAQSRVIFSMTPRYRKVVFAASGTMASLPSTEYRAGTKHGLPETINLVFLAFIFQAWAPKKDRTKSCRDLMCPRDAARVAVSSAYPRDATFSPGSRAPAMGYPTALTRPCACVQSRPQCRASRTRMKMRGARGSPCRTEDRTSKGSLGPSAVTTQLLLDHSEDVTYAIASSGNSKRSKVALIENSCTES